MTCPRCRLWASRTQEQLLDRKRKLDENPNTSAVVCPYCLTNDWATTTELIDPPQPPQSLWRRLWDIIK